MVDKKENVLVEFDYQNVFLIDPNKTIDAQGNVKERLVNHEQLIMYANLECNVLPRTKLSVGLGNDSAIQTISIAKINFLSQDGQKFLDNSYTNDVTYVNEGDINKKVIEQGGTLSKEIKSGFNTRRDNTSSSLLGITSISIKNDSSFQSTVSIELEDVRGRALFELGENSPYASFFNLPYPLFYLTIKGYFGKAVKLALMLQNFSARFNTGTGNFNVSLKFFTYKYSMISEVSMGALAAVPHMYKSNFTQLLTTNNSPSTTQGNTKNIILERGRQKITELYGEYKSKGLIPDDFPEITLWELYKRLELFLKNIENSYSKVEMGPLSDIDKYLEDLQIFQKKVEGSTDSWDIYWLDVDRYVISKQEINGVETNVKYYSLRKDFSNRFEDAKSDLDKLIKRYNELLNSNPTCGQNGNYTFLNTKTQSPTVIESNISVNDIVYTDKITIDWCETYKSQTRSKICTTPEGQETAEFKLFKETFPQNNTQLSNQNGETEQVQHYFYFDIFNTKINQYAKKRDEIAKQIEEDISKRLAERIKSKDSGIGFDPTIRNVLAVVFASGEAFLRLMDEVHTKSWDVRDDPNRKAAIFSSNASMDSVQSANGTTPVYPWPQYIVQKPGTDKDKEIYQITYPGDTDQLSVTHGNNYTIWPEIEFVEQFIFGLTQRDKPSETPSDALNELKQPARVSLNAIEFPIDNVVYRNQQQSKFFYEIWERLFVSSFYTNLNREGSLDSQINEVITEGEKENIKIALGSFSPYITKILKEYKIDKSNFTTLLRHISNDGTGESWQNFIRNNYVTNYIKNYINSDYNLFESSILTSTESQSTVGMKNQDKVVKYLDTTKSNKFIFTDTYPFTDITWLKNNMANGNAIQSTDIYNNTTKILKFDTSRNVICNFDVNMSLQENRPITNFSYLGSTKLPNVSTYNSLNLFYESRKISEQFPSEGSINYSSNNLNFPIEQSTAIFNTPFFINSIQTGVRNYQASNPYPFVNAAYFFLNSLPIATLRERYKSYKSGSVTDLDYISATLNKFGAVHKLPYAWILKYGSIWHRYKVWKETGIDIISNSNNDDWTDFNYVNNYDPITKSTTTQYQLNIPNIVTQSANSATIILEQNIPVNTFVTNTVMNTGFYPGLINDFNLFYQGVYLFNSYTSTDIQSAIDKGFKMIPGDNNPNGTFVTRTSFDSNFSGRTLFLKTWSCFVPKTSGTSTTDSVYILPSFGSNINQGYLECIDPSTKLLKTEITGNTSVYNGSVRLFWGAPNYGYFNFSGITKPSPDEYLKSIYIDRNQQDNFTLDSSYTDISEIFGVFKKEILDSFEQEFLNFSKSRYDYIPSKDKGNNFHILMRDLMLIDTPNGSSSESVIADAQSKQLGNIISRLKTFLQYDVVLKYGNPSGFDRKIFYSLSSTPVVDPFIPQTYSASSPNSLPTVGSTTTLATSQTNYPNEWAALELYVGFSNWRNLSYTDNGSFITDFFIDMNIEFSENNIKNLAPLIKIYVTQKLINNNLTRAQFIQLLDGYILSNTTFQDTVIDSLFTKLNADLPVYSESGELPKESALDGKQTKLELWESFKALNDKWISGYDFTNKTLFEDILFLDRASRNIGDQIHIDIYKLRDNLFNFGSSSSNMFFFVQTFIRESNFIIMTMPSYVNFYNVQDATKNPTPKMEGSLEFANTLFGTHETIDVRDSSSKMVCLYGGKPSSQLDIKNNNEVSRKDDSFDLSKPDNPLTENQVGKTDYAFSNRVVGFSVDMGIRNQNVFYSIQLDQNAGKATSESLQVLTDIANQAGGRKSYSQNASLWNFYNTRSYTCTVSCLGNALIQPTMYFNLRHVPMFHGPYLITDVSHSITPGRFETIFNGVRQPISALPTTPDYIQALNESVLTNIRKLLANDRKNNIDPNQNVKKEQNQVLSSVLATQKSSNVEFCKSGLTQEYVSFVENDIKATTVSFNEAKTSINKVTTIETIRVMIFVTMYLNSISPDETHLTNFDYNYGSSPLSNGWGSGTKQYFKEGDSFNCLRKGDTSDPLPYATFASFENYINFLFAKWDFIPVTNFLSTIDENTVTRCYVDYYPYDKGGLYNQMKANNSLTDIVRFVKKALDKWNELNQ